MSGRAEWLSTTSISTRLLLGGLAGVSLCAFPTAPCAADVAPPAAAGKAAPAGGTNPAPPAASGPSEAAKPAEIAALSADQVALLSGPIGRPPAPHPADEAVEMVLDASLNGSPTSQLLTMTRTPQGKFSGKASELRRIRIKLDPALSPNDTVALDDLPGVTYAYDEANQSIALHVPDALLQSYQVRLGGDRTATDLDAVKPTPGMLLNYSLYASHSGGFSQVSGDVEALGMTRFGIFSTTGLFNSQHVYGGSHVTRLDSSWRLIDPRAIRSYTLGDFASNALSWTSSVRLGGFQIASAFDQRPDIVTTALPQFSGSAALPSSLDLFVNQQKVFSGEIPSGPFDLKSLPYVSGGDVKLITTDATGRQVVIDKSYYYVAGQLKAGLLQYSFDIGAPRLDYGIRSLLYDDTVFASGSARYGVTDNLTVEGHVEASADGLANGGVGVVKSFAGIGAVSASIAGSHYKGYSGGKVSVELEGQIAGVRWFATTDRTMGDYFDLARVSYLRTEHRYNTVAGPDPLAFVASTAQASAIDRAGLSFTPWFDRTSVSLSYNRIKAPGNNQRLGSLSLSRSVSNRASLYVTGYSDLDHSRQYGVYATLNIQIGNNINVSAGGSHDNGRNGYSVSATGTTGQRQGDVGWGVSDQEYQGSDGQRSAYVSWRAPVAQLRAQIDQSGDQWRESLQVQGSLVAAGGGVFAADRIGQAFAIVKNAGPGAEVMQGGVRMGQANGAGRLLLPDLIPYYEQQIFIDPTNLPDGWEPATTEQTAVAGYRQGTVVDFGAKLIHGAVLILNGKDGKPIPPGYTVQLDGGESSVVGYDGQAYLRGLRATNRISIDLGPAGLCSASFAYDLKGPAQPQIGPLTCQ